MLAFALGLAGVVNLFTALSQGISSEPPARFTVWTPTIGALLVAVLFAAAGVMPATGLRHQVRFFTLALEVAAPFLGLLDSAAAAPKTATS